ncbi:MAG: anti-sigma factor antagonist [Eubacteriales bacterium]|nr:anti-sigma factor antagonist [Eubacteriales bacterium]
MKIQYEKIENILLVKFFGEIDHHYTEEIREKIDREFAKSYAKNILFDFSDVDFMDSSGIGMIIGRYKLTKEIGGETLAFGLKDSAKRIFEMSGLLKLIPIFKTKEDAINVALGR